MGFSWELKQGGGVVPAIWCDGCIEPVVTSDALTICSLDVEGDEEDSDYQIVTIAAADVLIVCGQGCLEQVGGSSGRAVHPLKDYLAWLCLHLQPQVDLVNVALEGMKGVAALRDQS